MDKRTKTFQTDNLITTNTSENNMDIRNDAPHMPQRRKILKPLMEKRRRARINASLTELKTFLLDTIKKEGLRPNKMEKADILELTVKQLRHLHKQDNIAETNSKFGKDTFVQGFSACASKVSSFLNADDMPEVDASLQTRLTEHLLGCNDTEKMDVTTQNHVLLEKLKFTNNQNKKYDINQMELLSDSDFQLNKPIHNSIQMSTGNEKIMTCFPNNVSQPSGTVGEFQKPHACSCECPNKTFNKTVNRNPFVQIGSTNCGLLLVPMQLPSGEIAYVVPSQGTENRSPNIVLSTLTFTYPVQSETCSFQGQLNTDIVHKASGDFENSKKVIFLDKGTVNISDNYTGTHSGVEINSTSNGYSNMSNTPSTNISNSPRHSTFNNELQGSVWRPW